MTDLIDLPATLVGGGPCTGDDINLALTFAPYLVGVDSGADRVLAAGLVPQRVYGDLDSLSEEGRNVLHDRLIAVTEQVTTDFDKALRSLAAPVAIAVGFSGGRLDHELAVLNALVRLAQHICLVLGPESVTFLCPPVIHLDLPVGTVLSLFPFAPVGLTNQGLLWPTEGLDFRPDGRVGTSNAVEGPVTLRPTEPAMLVILPRECLPQAFAAVSNASRWPARGGH